MILHDDLVDPGVLDLARREARRIAVGKRGGRPSTTQSDIVAALLAEAAEGRRVVRLRGGDPAVFGRLSEEIEACAAAGVPVEVVPGVTAALGAAASGGRTRLTHRTQAPRLQFVTAHAPDGELPDDLNGRRSPIRGRRRRSIWGVRTLAPFVARLLAEGLPAETPALLVTAATTARETSTRGTLAGLPALAAEHGGDGPTLVVSGRSRADRTVAAGAYPASAQDTGRSRPCSRAQSTAMS